MKISKTEVAIKLFFFVVIVGLAILGFVLLKQADETKSFPVFCGGMVSLFAALSLSGPSTYE